MAAPPDPDKKALDLVLKDLSSAAPWHNDFVTRVDAWYKAWRGAMDETAESAGWTSKQHPPYAMATIDAILANVIDDRLRATCKPKPRIESDMDRIMALQQSARAHEILANFQLDQERFQDKLWQFFAQAAICNLSAFKTYWRHETRDVTKRVPVTQMVYDDVGQIVGAQLAHEEQAHNLTVFDGPCSEVVDMRDFWWNPEGAVSWDRVDCATHRTWSTKDEIQRQVDAGYYKDKMAEINDTSDHSGLGTTREQGLFNQSRTKGMVEVLERWTRDRVITVANRKVVLRDEKNPFWHGELPFVVCTLHPDQFRINGISEVEKIQDLQEAIWSFTNARLDQTLLAVATPIFLGPTVDPDDIEWAPMAMNQIDGDPATAVFIPNLNTNPVQVSLAAEDKLRGDIQTISGAAPFLGGSDQSGIDNQTATGISITTTLAQKMMAFKKQQGYNAMKRLLDQRSWLNRQFITKPVLVEIVGDDGEAAYESIHPEVLQPDVYFDFEAAGESLIQQQQRSESQALLQTMAQIAPNALALGAKINMKALIEDHMKAYGKDNVERYVQAAQQQPQAPPGQPDPSQGPQGPDQPTNGVTSPYATSVSSPSNATSMSPAVFGQRFGAGTGPQQ